MHLSPLSHFLTKVFCPRLAQPSHPRCLCHPSSVFACLTYWSSQEPWKLSLLAFWGLSHFHCICQLLNKAKQPISSLVTGCEVFTATGYTGDVVKQQLSTMCAATWFRRCHCETPFRSLFLLSGVDLCTSLAFICGASFPCVLWAVVRASSCRSPVRSAVTCLGLG